MKTLILPAAGGKFLGSKSCYKKPPPYYVPNFFKGGFLKPVFGFVEKWGGNVHFPPHLTFPDLTFFSLNIFCSNFQGVRGCTRQAQKCTLLVKIENLKAPPPPITDPYVSEICQNLIKVGISSPKSS